MGKRGKTSAPEWGKNDSEKDSHQSPTREGTKLLLKKKGKVTLLEAGVKERKGKKATERARGKKEADLAREGHPVRKKKT